MFRPLIAAAVLAVLAPAPALAQDGGSEEIVVTGSRLERFEDLRMPHVAMRKRADSVVVLLSVRSDTRDAAQRRTEMRQALRDLDARGRSGRITLALIDDDDIVRPFSLELAQNMVHAERLPDTSAVTVNLRTVVSPDDTLDTIQARFAAFVAAAPKPGRVDMETSDLNLVLSNPEQYHAPLVTQITSEGRGISAQLGEGYGINVTGLEGQVAWRRTGELELTLFLPYTLTVVPRG